MKSVFLLLPALLLTIATTAQFTFSTGELVEKREVKPFRSIKTGDGIEVILVQGDDHAVAVSAARAEYMQRLKTEVIDGVLKIYYDRESLSDWVSSGKKLKAYVSLRTLDRLVAVAGSHVSIQGILKEEAVTFMVQSGASVTGKTEAGKLVVEAESGARMELTGAAGLLSISANSGAKVDAAGVSAGKADIRCTTGAKIEIKANDEMKFYAATGGSIYYTGDGKIISIEKKSGSVIRKSGQ